MTNLRFRQVFEDMFKQVNLNCNVNNKKKMNIIWKMIKNYLYSNKTLHAETLFNILLNMYKTYSHYGGDKKFVRLLEIVRGEDDGEDE